MRTTDRADRVKIWNSFLQLAWSEAEKLSSLTGGGKSSQPFKPEEILDDEKFHILATLSLCTLAIEARANHLIDWLVDQGKIDKITGDAAQRLPPEHKWFLLPKLAGKRRQLAKNSGPHQAIKEICRLRNAVVHVKFRQLTTDLPKANRMLSLFRRFIAAMEDMNVILGRLRRPRDAVLRIGRFGDS